MGGPPAEPNPTYAVRLTGLADISQGVGIQFWPYALVEWQREPGAGQLDATGG